MSKKIFTIKHKMEGGGKCAVAWENKKSHQTKQLELKFQTRLDYIGRLDWFAKKNVDKHRNIVCVGACDKVQVKICSCKKTAKHSITQLRRQY